ncbi:MAG TPA: Uma2 family endonuclease [Bryobacteraceae bacterium]|nr:Uma2 family endonuclease [Bryobacteraceae bacterium]
MSSNTQIRAEDYLRMTFEHDAEFVHGDIVERSMPDKRHAKIQLFLLLRFGSLMQASGLYPLPELRVKLAPDVYRIPDVCVFVGEPEPLVPDSPPLVAIEILSKDDRYSDVIEKLDEYRVWGVQNIWLIDPIAKRLAVYTAIGAQNVATLSLPEYSLHLTPAELFDNL